MFQRLQSLSLQTVKHILIGIVTVGMVVGLLICFFIAGSKTLTNNESVLLGVLVSFLSLLASWLLTHVYAEFSSRSATEEAKRAYDEKISTFARKAAEKVFNLSNEFDRLSESLKAALDESEDEERTKAVVVVLREKMLSAIHVLETLKSMNDTSLSDWQGIIGDDIQLQRQLQRQIENELEEQREIISKLESRMSGANADSNEKRLREVEQRIIEKVAALPFGFRPIQRGPKKEEVAVSCPGCKTSNAIRIRIRPGMTKIFQCSGCRHFVVTTYLDGAGLHSEMAAEKELTTTCQICHTQIAHYIPDKIGASASLTCLSCGTTMTASYSKDGIKYTSIDASNLTPKFLDTVLSLVPSKPWPQGMHKSIAQTMGVSNKTIDRAIGRLIADGRLQPNPPTINPTSSHEVAPT